MPNRSSDALFQLVKSMEKAEKRNFKLFASRNTGGGEMKTIALFDAMDKMEEYDETGLLAKNKTLSKQQLPNLKAYLYKQILASLRVLKSENSIEVQLHEQMQYAWILYDKGLFQQSLKVLEKVAETAKTNHQSTFWLQSLVFQKRIESLHITRANQDRAQVLSTEVEFLTRRLSLTGELSNLSLQLYSWYIKMGHARNTQDVLRVKEIFAARLSLEAQLPDGFFSRIYLYQCYCWYAFILQDFLTHYRYSQKWVDMFAAEPHMRRVETVFYIKGVHNLLLSNFMLRNHRKFIPVLQEFEEFAASPEANGKDNVRVQTFIYLNVARLHRHFMEGTFREGLVLVPEIEAGLEEFRLQIDPHRELVFYYKIASLYFGAGDCDRALDYLNRIIQWKVDLRGDLQCYARLLQLISHYELGNFQLLEHLVKSVYRFMAKMENLSVVEESVFRFLRRSLSQQNTAGQLKAAFSDLREKLKSLEKDPLESRSFMYLDIISWLDSKIEGVAVQEVLQRKFREQQRGATLPK